MPVFNSVNQTIDWIAMNDSQIQSLLNAICFQNLKCRKMTNFTGNYGKPTCIISMYFDSSNGKLQ